MELRDALDQIAQIRLQMARSQVFRGYRAATTAFSGLIAGLTGLLQVALLPDPAANPLLFVEIWSAAAVVCLAAVGIEMVIRTRRSASDVQRSLTLLAVEQFMPSVLAGGLLTYVLCQHLPQLLWMLPPLWMVLFALGVFASARLLPRMIFAVGGYYLLAGIFTLVLTANAASPWRFNPWIMPGVFGIGQFTIAAILYWKLERHHG